MGRVTEGNDVDSSAMVTAPGCSSIDLLVETLHERDGLQILAAAVLVRQPFGALVVAIEHRRDCIDAQAVEVVSVQPEERAVDQELLHLVALVVEDHGAPVFVLAQPAVGVFVEGRAVERDQAVVVLGEVRGHPIQDDADVGLVQGIDESLEIIRGAEAAGGRKEAGDLIAPRRVERMLGDGQQLDMGVAQLFDIRDESLRPDRDR